MLNFFGMSGVTDVPEIQEKIVVPNPKKKLSLIRSLFVVFVIVASLILIYLKLVESGYSNPFYVLLLYVFGLCFIIWVFYMTAPNNLFNKDYRYSKEGRKLWKKK